MKNLVLGIVLGATIFGGIAQFCINGYVEIIDYQEDRIEYLESRIDKLEVKNASLVMKEK